MGFDKEEMKNYVAQPELVEQIEFTEWTTGWLTEEFEICRVER